jgi:murein DD-endopeptidase MepM/ murein hydrolase activator NlpD
VYGNTYAVYRRHGKVRIFGSDGRSLGVEMNQDIEDGAIIRTYQDSELLIQGNGYIFKVYRSSHVDLKGEPVLVYGKLSRSRTERFIDLHFYYSPTPAQGGTMKVVASTADGGVEMFSYLINDGGGKKPLDMYSLGDGRFRALTGFDCETPPIRYWLNIVGRGDDGAFTQVIYPFYLRRTTYGIGKVNLSRDSYSLLKPSEKKKREIDHLSRILSTASAHALWDGKFRFPLEEVEIISSFGKRRSYYSEGRRVRIRSHRGTDFRASRGEYVYAPNSGIVVLATARVTTGNTLVIDHGQGVFSLFFHLDSVECEPGDAVETSDKIAEAGSTGITAGPHLHWSVVVDGTYVDPVDWVKRSF